MNTNESQLSANPVAVIGGLLGLLPFWGLAFAELWATGDWVVSALAHLVNYAALILAFVGAIWWGIALNGPQGLVGLASRGFLFGWSLVPCLLAWFLLTLDRQMALIGFAALLVLQLLLDFIFLWRVQLIARWFWQLRVVLTVGAAPALLFAGVFE
ncbi:DUF3429 domain-containing protein [Cellvibrio fibrivorans]|uniref:DUF3429 domain-containing protein n=1 Tax=Cellvibrio fibrivorans TaxID=126350 RepID=A0ABU1UV38_9GAMM|nr:DUF3429 domain-containing protein [Cellvibrio fibrivorans]MDR7089042.1 hypothetical protein [Cellvibrio fibrivorans]